MGVYTLSKKRAPLEQHEQDYLRAMLEAYGAIPQGVNAQYTASTIFYKKLLTRLVKGLIDIEVPLEWDIDYMLDAILLDGKIIVIDGGIGAIPLKGNISGVNVFNRPTNVKISNPVLGSLSGILGVDAEVIYLNDNINFNNITSLLDTYSQKLANCDCSIDVNLINTRVTKIFECADSAQAATAKAIYDDMSAGKPAVFIHKGDALDKENNLNFYDVNVKNTYVADLIQIEKRCIIEEFLTFFGVNNANIDKRERLNSDEVNSNNDELRYYIKYWNDNLKRCCGRVNKRFGLNISITFSNYEDLQSSAVELSNTEGTESEDDK